MYRLLTIFVSCSLLYAQQFSPLHRAQEQFLNFDEEEVSQNVYIDESSGLVWQNSKRLRLVSDPQRARHICKNLKIEGYRWQLPSLSQLQSLSNPRLKPSMKSGIRFGAANAYIASNKPLWDNTLHYGFNYATAKTLLFHPHSRRLYVRCVAELE